MNCSVARLRTLGASFCARCHGSGVPRWRRPISCLEICVWCEVMEWWRMEWCDLLIRQTPTQTVLRGKGKSGRKGKEIHWVVGKIVGKL